MVTSHPWLVSAAGDVEQNNLRISNHSYRTKQVNFTGISTISASESCHQQLCHIWNPTISCLSYYLIVRVPIYVIFTANLWAVLPCFNFSVSGEESWIFQSSEFFFFFFIRITVKLAENTEVNWCWCIFNHLSCIKSFSFLYFLVDLFGGKWI